ncbi:uncharacterized protein A4U43_C01F9420 [Asparagus officinalis]|uniref:Uncharacterized protein n=1 Tax=Asparagus officinalis TaxID=4686 RepID=A0A5P1FN43_ASPOF|nr:uncharacterized protein A4U43_C01F9420 [Asparagus officinalis]
MPSMVAHPTIPAITTLPSGVSRPPLNQPAESSKHISAALANLSSPLKDPGTVSPKAGVDLSPPLVEVMFKGVRIKIARDSWDLLSPVLEQSDEVAPPHSQSFPANQAIRISSSVSGDKDSSSDPPPGFEKKKVSARKKSSRWAKTATK